jgi:uncharacterized protein
MTDNAKNKIAQDIAALRTRNKSALQAIMAHDIVWSLPGTSTMLGEAHGVDAILKRAEIFHSYGVKIEIEHVVYGFRDVALHLHNTGNRDGLILDEHLTTVCHLDGERIRLLDTFISDVEMLNAFFV